jgi:hypothetical protein
MGLSNESILEAEGLKAYSKNMREEFEQEWRNRKFKWLFKNKRKSKIKSKIYKKYRFEIFDIVDKICGIEIPIRIEETIEGFQYIDTIDKTDVIYPIGDFTPLLDSLTPDYRELLIDKNIK